MRKRLLASLTALCLALSLLPTAALATGEGGTDGAQDSDTTPVIVTPAGDPAAPVPTGSGPEAKAVEPDTSWYTDVDEGTTEFTISDVADLLGLAVITQNAAKTAETRTGDPADNFAGKTVTLAADLNLADVPWFERGESDSPPTADHRIVRFAGTFDGEGHTISNLSFTSKNVDKPNYLGLFHSITNTGTVENLTLDTVTALLSDNDWFGALAYQFLGTAENCHVKNVTVTGTATGNADIRAAGMMFYCQGEESKAVSLTSCTVTDLEVKVDGSFQVGGGLVGRFGGPTALTVEDCSAEEIHFEADSLRLVSGLLGYAVPTEENVTITVSNCLVSGVSFKAEELIAACGFSHTGSYQNEAAFTFTDCYVKDAHFECGTGQMGYVGGFSNLTNRLNTYQNCTVDGVVFQKGSPNTRCYQMGGFSGNTQNDLEASNQEEAAKFYDCCVTGLYMQVAGPMIDTTDNSIDSVGGFIGTATQGWTTIEDCSVTGTIDSPQFEGNIGGFIGSLGWNRGSAQIVQQTNVKNCTAKVDVTAKGNAGGFIGYSSDQFYPKGYDLDAVDAKMEDCTAKGSVTSLEGAAGGFVGAGDRGTYTNCTADGMFVSGVTAGGFWGEIFPLKVSDKGLKVSITGCKAYNSVQGSGHAAGFLGYADTTDGSKTTSVTINSSAASPAVTIIASTTTISCFLNKSDDSDTGNITLGTGDDANTRSITIAKPDDSNGKIELDELNGDMEIKDAAANATRCQEEGKKVALPVGSVIHRDGSITIPADEENPYGSTIDPEGTRRTHGVLTVSPDSSTVYSNAGTTSFTYTYNGDGPVTAKSSDSSVATASVSGNTVTVTILKAGNANITVSAPQTNAYTAASDVHTLTVLQYTSSGGSSSGTTTYPITVEDSRNGEAESNRHRAERGDTVTITVDPDRGYELDELIVTDSSGDEIEVRRLSNGKYTFTMPRSAVTVEAVFTAAAAEGTFADVSPDAYYADAVEWAVANGITGGTTATTFSPNNPCTRAHAVTFLWRAAGEPEPETTAMPFTDVAEGAYYYDAVLWAMENGITEGTTETTFSPDAPCTRAQIVTFLWRSEGKPAPQSAMGFTDVAAGAYYFDAVAWAVENGITNGTSAAAFSPYNTCTRAQIVTFIYRCMA